VTPVSQAACARAWTHQQLCVHVQLRRAKSRMHLGASSSLLSRCLVAGGVYVPEQQVLPMGCHQGEAQVAGDTGVADRIWQRVDARARAVSQGSGVKAQLLETTAVQLHGFMCSYAGLVPGQQATLVTLQHGSVSPCHWATVVGRVALCL
jgi:hypothetical protein